MKKVMITITQIFMLLLTSSGFAQSECESSAKCEYFTQVGKVICGYGCDYFTEIGRIKCSETPGGKCTYFPQIGRVVCGVACDYFTQINRVQCYKQDQ